MEPPEEQPRNADLRSSNSGDSSNWAEGGKIQKDCWSTCENPQLHPGILGGEMSGGEFVCCAIHELKEKQFRLLLM